MKKIIAAALIMSCNFWTLPTVSACTTFLVGRDASADGSAYIGRTEDTVDLKITKLVDFPASKKAGTFEYVDSGNGFRLTLPNAHHRCLVAPIDDKDPNYWWESGINDAGVGFSATETIRVNDAILKHDPLVTSGLCEENIPRLVLPYINSAKEGVLYLGKLMERYGTTSNEAVIFIDNDDIWYMELLSGHQWAAYRMPQDTYACIGNDCLLDYYNPADKENWLGSSNVIQLAKKAGTYKEVDGKFHLAESYTPGRRDYSQLRVWASRRYFNNSKAGAYDVNTRHEFNLKPEKKITLQELFALSRDRHQNTSLATDLPGHNTRPIGIDRTTSVHFLRFHKDRTPVMWLSQNAPEFSVYLPIYANASKLPKEMTIASSKYDDKSLAWELRLISDLAVINRANYAQPVRSRFDALEDKLIKVVENCKNPTPAEADKMLQDVNKMALDTTKEVKTELITKVSQDVVLSTKNLGRD
ncbi:MAG: C69 family dipeptidase [Phascolarctobacterium sp.]|nr:C69 family dipeptidase [Phascolarctobacterium sp.]